MNLKQMIESAVNARIAQLFDGDAAVTTPAVTHGRDVETIASVSAPATRTRRTRRQAPAVGYHLNVDKRVARKTAADVLAHNPASVLMAVLEHPGSTNRQLTELLADEVPAGKKAIESALDMLRTIDAAGNKLERGSRKQKTHALVVSREL